VKNLQQASRVLNAVVSDLDAGKGVVGALLRDEQLKTNLTRVVVDAGSLVSNLNRFGLLYKPKPPKTERPRPDLPYHGRNL